MSQDTEKNININIKETGASKVTKSFDNLKKGFSDLGKVSIKSFGDIGTAFKTLGKAFIANPIGLAITAITAGITALWNAFKKNDAAMTSLQKVGAAFKPLMDVVQRGLQWVVDKLGVVAEWLSNKIPGVISSAISGITSNISTFINFAAKIANKLGMDDLAAKWRGAADAVTEWGQKTAEAYTEAANAAQDNVKKSDNYEEARRRFVVNEAKRNKQIADLRAQLAATDKDDYETRKRLLDSIIALEEANSKEKVELAEEELRQLRYNAKVTGDTSDETANAIANAEAKVINARAEANNASRRFIKERKDLDDEEAKSEEEKVRKLVSLIEGYTKQAFGDSIEYQRQTLKEGLDKQQADLDEALDKKLITQEQYNALLVKLAKDYNAKLVDIDNKQIEGDTALAVLKAKNAGEDAEKIYQIELDGLDKRMALYDEESKEYQELLAKKLELEKNYTDSLSKEAEERYKNSLKSADEVVGYFKSAMDTISEINSIITEQEDSEFESYQEKQETKKEILKERLEQGLISQENYEAGVQRLDEETEKKQKELNLQQAKRQKAMAIMNATLNAAGAIIASLASAPVAIGPIPNPAGIASLALATAMGIAQVAAAIATPLPKAAKGGIAGGGILSGPSHKEGGIKIEAEGGEAIINKKSTAKYAGLLSAINEAGGGVSFASRSNRYFANGGIIDGGYSTNYTMSKFDTTKALKKVKIYTTIEDIRRGEEIYSDILTNREV